MRAVLLDRDGVINQAFIRDGKPYPPSSIDELIIPDEVQPALAKLHACGFILVAVTNQPDVARGTTTRAIVEEMNTTLMRQLPLTEILVCYHDDTDACQCRKPKPGLLMQAAQKYKIDLSKSVMIGDRWRDIEAGKNAGCKTIWIDRNYLEQKPNHPDFIACSLQEAVDWLLKTAI